MKIGLLFGSFNPIHNGHIEIGKMALDFVDRVIYVVSPLSPDKDSSNMTNYEFRYDMVKLAIGGNERLEVSDIESHLPVPTRTYRTILEFQKMYVDDELYLIFGSDNINAIDSWMEYVNILSKYPLIGYVRDGIELNKPVAHRIISNNPISSTKIRNDLFMYKQDLNPLVFDYCISNNLFKTL